jgi:hypothetical protein
MFRHQRQLRRWAARVLFVWLFGIASGVAHACFATSLMAPGGWQSGSTVALEAASGGAAASAGGHHHATHRMSHEGVPAHDGSPGKSNCSDFCEKSTVSIPSLKSALDHLQDHALPLPAVAVVLPAPVFSPVELLLPRRDGGLAHPPITIAFLRLAL